jgi:hypothetical protein
MTRRVALRPIEYGDVDRIFGWVSKPWYVEEFCGSAMPTRESHRVYFDNILNSKYEGGGIPCG